MVKPYMAFIVPHAMKPVRKRERPRATRYGN
jgi:hypothetical protein